MQSFARWTGGMGFEGKFSTGHDIKMDTSVDQGGGDTGPRPIEMLLMGLAGCTGMDTIAILQKKRQKISSFQVTVTGERREEQPRVFTHVKVTYEVKGENLDVEAIRQAVHLSEEKYCSVSNMLKKAIPIVYEIRVKKDGAAR
ncbi:MAG: OsmC family protein [Candidatus Eisenbacteria bacterium]